MLNNFITKLERILLLSEVQAILNFITYTKVQLCIKASCLGLFASYVYIIRLALFLLASNLIQNNIMIIKKSNKKILVNVKSICRGQTIDVYN